MNANDLIDSAWYRVSYRTMNYAWKKLWPECVPNGDLQVEQDEKLADKIEEKEHDEEDVSCALIKEMNSKCIDLQRFAENINQTY